MARFFQMTSWQATLELAEINAERMFRYEPSVMLYAPLRNAIYAGPDGDTQLAIDQPGLTFSSYDDSRIADVGRELDTLLAQLISLLGADPPAQVSVTGQPATES